MPGLFDGTPLERPVTCERCGKALDACDCPKNEAGEVCEARDQSPRVRREKRRGKWATIIAELDPTATDLKALLKEMRTGLGTGGGITDGEIVLQGDHREKVVELLVAKGYRAKAAGG